MAVLDIGDDTIGITYFDPYGKSNPKRVQKIQDYVKYQFKNMGQKIPNIKITNYKKFGHQTNQDDCGIYCLTMVEQVIKRKSINLMPNNMAMRRCSLKF